MSRYGGPPPAERSVFQEVGIFKESFVESIADLCGWWAGIVYDHPHKIIWASLAVAAFACFGFLPGIAQWVDGADTLYALPHTQARNDGILHNSLFSDSLSLANFILITSDPPGENIFTWHHLEYAYQVDQMVRGNVVDLVLGQRIALPPLPEYLPGLRATNLNSTRDFNHQGGSFYSSSTSSEQQYWGAKIFSTNLFNAKPPSLATVEVKHPINRVLTYEQDFCAINAHGKCSVSGIFEMGIMDMKKILPPNSPPELYILGGSIFNLERKGFVPDYILGGMETKKCMRELPTAVLLNFFEASQLRPGSTPSKSRVTLDCVVAVKGNSIDPICIVCFSVPFHLRG